MTEIGKELTEKELKELAHKADLELTEKSIVAITNSIDNSEKIVQEFKQTCDKKLIEIMVLCGIDDKIIHGYVTRLPNITWKNLSYTKKIYWMMLDNIITSLKNEIKDK
jgi:hypothetical protein